MKKVKVSVLAFAVLLGVVVAAPLRQSALASPASQAQDGVNMIGGDETGANTSFGTVLKKIVDTMLFIIGALAVVMIVFGGIKYTTSRGEAAEVTAAKNTVLYAVIGLVVALLAYAVVQFVVSALNPAPNLPPPITRGKPS